PPSPALFPYTTLFRSFFVGVVAAVDEEGVTVHGLQETSKTAVSGLQNLPAHARQLVVVATGDGIWLETAEDSALGHFQGETAKRDRKSTRLNSSHVSI